MTNTRALQETFKGLQSGEVTANPAGVPGWDGSCKTSRMMNHQHLWLASGTSPLKDSSDGKCQMIGLYGSEEDARTNNAVLFAVYVAPALEYQKADEDGKMLGFYTADQKYIWPNTTPLAIADIISAIRRWVSFK